MKSLSQWPAPLGFWVPEFKLTELQHQSIARILEKRASALEVAAFVQDIEQILGTQKEILVSNRRDVPRHSNRKADARAIAKSAHALRQKLRATPRFTLELIDQGFWVLDKVKYPNPARESAREIDAQLGHLIASCEWLAAKPAPRGAPGKGSIATVVKLVGKAYERRLKLRPGVSPSSLFYRLAGVWLPALGEYSENRYRLLKRALQ